MKGEEMSMEKLTLWIAQNQGRITRAILTAFKKVDGVSEALTDIDVTGDEKTKQKIEGLITAARGVLAEYTADAFEEEFTDQHADVRDALKRNSRSIVHGRKEEFVTLLVDSYKADLLK